MSGNGDGGRPEGGEGAFAVDIPEPIVVWLAQLPVQARKDVAERLERLREELGVEEAGSERVGSEGVGSDGVGQDGAGLRGRGSDGAGAPRGKVKDGAGARRLVDGEIRGSVTSGPFVLEYRADRHRRMVEITGVQSARGVRPVLVVDDDPELRATICEVLAEAGYRVEPAENGVAALQKLATLDPPPGLIVLDLVMPKMDGWELLNHLKSDPRRQDVPVVVVSGGTNRPALVHGFLPKPFDQGELLETVKRHCGEPAVGDVDFRKLFEGSRGLYLVLRPDLTIVAASDAYLAATGTRRTDILGRHLFEVFPDRPDGSNASGIRNLRASFDRVLERRASDAMPLQRYEVPRPSEKGGGLEERWWSPVNAPVLGPDGRTLYIVHQVEDVTELVRLRERGVEQARREEELSQRAAQIEAEISVWEQRLAEGERRTELEQQLIGIVSHDLRNPIQSIAVGGTLLLTQGSLTDRQRSIVGKILNAADRAGRLIRDLLDFTQVRLGGRLPVYRIPDDLFARTEEVLDELRSAHPGRVLVWQRSGSGEGRWDKDRIAQVITNLVTNAFNYGEDGAPVRVIARDLGHEVAIDVHNEGPPIPDGERHKLFHPMQRGDGQGGDSRPGDGRSLGLGLFITRAIVAAHGGDIQVVSADGAGTCFTVRMPRA